MGERTAGGGSAVRRERSPAVPTSAVLPASASAPSLGLSLYDRAVMSAGEDQGACCPSLSPGHQTRARKSTTMPLLALRAWWSLAGERHEPDAVWERHAHRVRHRDGQAGLPHAARTGQREEPDIIPQEDLAEGGDLRSRPISGVRGSGKVLT